MLWVCKVNFKVKAVERTYSRVIWTITAASNHFGHIVQIHYKKNASFKLAPKVSVENCLCCIEMDDTNNEFESSIQLRTVDS